MAFAATAPDGPVTSDVSAGGSADPGPGDEARSAATPTPPADADARDEASDSDRASGAAERVADTDGTADSDGTTAAVDPDAVVPEDFVPVFVSDDLTGTGAHTSATPEPAQTAPPPPASPAAAPTAPPASTPTRPTVDPAPVPTPTPVPATPQPPADQDESDGPPRGDGSGGGGPSAADWAALRECESSGSYGIDSGNGYYGAYQFSQATWDWIASIARPDLVGVVPSDASPGDQDALAFALYDMRGAAPWPTCGAYLR